tara:strand:- start:7 stop:1251 length:1245 start_codon:yes stop_codon:yes gene_type:complete
MKKKNIDNELDLTQILFILINNKFKIILISFIFFSITFVLPGDKGFKATTIIKPISLFDENEYLMLNKVITLFDENDYLMVNNESKGKWEWEKVIDKVVNYRDFEMMKENSKDNENIIGINEITRQSLLDLFVEELDNNKVLIKAIKKFGLLDRSNYKSEENYSQAVEKKTTALNVLKANKDRRKGKIQDHAIIEFSVNDIDKWNKALVYIESEINNNIRKLLIKDFNNKIKSYELLKQIDLEELQVKIDRSIDDYEIETSSKLSFLKEQALIARELGLEKTDIVAVNELKIFRYDNLTYLRGYKAIEKEIELINNRLNKKDFNSVLHEYEKRKAILIDGKKVEYIKKIFSDTPIASSSSFQAGKIDFNDTKYKSLSFGKFKLSIIITMIGFLFAIFYVVCEYLFKNSIKKNKF